MKKLSYIFFLCCMLVLSCDSPKAIYSNTSQIENESKPNIVIIFADDLGYGDLSCYGHPSIHTPRLDEMAQQGIRLSSYYAASCVCTPSRAGLMTGRYPLRIGQPGNLGPNSKAGMSLDERTLATALKSNGYRTAAFGKWHLGAVEGYFPTDRGFDEYFGILYSNDMMPPWVKTERPLHLYRGDQPTKEYPVDQTTLTMRYTDEAIRFIEESGDNPFFLYVPHSMPHLPIYASEDFQHTSKGGDYGDTIEEMDYNVGRILDTIEALGKSDNTLIIFTSDNGPWRNMPPRMYTTEPVEKWHGGSTGPLRGAKATTYEGGYRVPCIMKWPGKIKPKQVNAELINAMDLHTTILDLTDTTYPEKPLDGKNIWSVITDQTIPSPHTYYHYFRNRRLDAVRDKRYKLRLAPPADNWISPEMQTGEEAIQMELFDLLNDPFEQFDISTDNQEIVNKLKREIKRMATELGAQSFTLE